MGFTRKLRLDPGAFRRGTFTSPARRQGRIRKIFNALIGRGGLIGDCRGSFNIVFSLALIPMIGFFGVGVDYARLVHMKTTLQAASDAAALSGAAANFGTAAQESTASDGPYSVAQNYFTNAWLPPNLNVTPTINAPVTSSVSGATVTVTATAQVGPSFLAIWSSHIPVSVAATATAEVPGAATGAFPYTIQQCVFSTAYPYWNTITGEPNIDPTTGKPYEITFASTYSSSGDPCLYGEWTSLLSTDTSASSVANIETYTCNCTLSIGNSINIASGSQATNYGNANTLYSSGGADAGQIILIPIVQVLTTGTTAVVAGFAPFIIDSADQGQKTITGHLSANYHGGGLSGSGGQYFGSDVVTLIN